MVKIRSGSHIVFALMLVILLTTQIAGSASAHKPIFNSGGEATDTALEIPDALVSYAIYAQFDPSLPQIQYYEFGVLAGDMLTFQILIPAVEGLEQFAPSALIIGAGLPPPTAEASAIIDQFSIPLSAGDGVILWSYNGLNNVEEFEPFTQTTFWVRQDAELAIPGNGTYYLAIMVPEGSYDAGGEGKYVLAPGKEEDFGLMDYVAIPLDWVLARMFWGQNPLLYLAPTFAVVAVGMWILCLRTRADRSLVPDRVIEKASMNAGFIGGLLMIGTGANQILLIVASPHLSGSALNAVVIMIQAVAMLLGFLSIRLTMSLAQPRGWAFIVLPVVLTFFALMLGAGFIVGPAAFLAGCTVQFMLGRTRITE